MQVMYFLPQMREYFLQAVPDAAKEFSLLDELALLFRMLASESGHACQATNLLRALRQAREAGGLGLLEGHASGGQSGTDIEVCSSLPSGILTASSHAKTLSNNIRKVLQTFNVPQALIVAFVVAFSGFQRKIGHSKA